jgi:hypothetical protein
MEFQSAPDLPTTLIFLSRKNTRTEVVETGKTEAGREKEAPPFSRQDGKRELLTLVEES